MRPTWKVASWTPGSPARRCGGAALVEAMTTDVWGTARARLARIVGRGVQATESDLARELEESAGRVVGCLPGAGGHGGGTGEVDGSADGLPHRARGSIRGRPRLRRLHPGVTGGPGSVQVVQNITTGRNSFIVTGTSTYPCPWTTKAAEAPGDWSELAHERPAYEHALLADGAEDAGPSQPVDSSLPFGTPLLNAAHDQPLRRTPFPAVARGQFRQFTSQEVAPFRLRDLLPRLADVLPAATAADRHRSLALRPPSTRSHSCVLPRKTISSAEPRRCELNLQGFFRTT